MYFSNAILLFIVCIVAINASILQPATFILSNATLSADNSTSPGTGFSSASPIRPGLDLTTAQITGWDLFPQKAFLYVKRFPEEQVDQNSFVYDFKEALGSLPTGRGPLKNGRFSLSLFGRTFFQITVNLESPLYQNLDAETVRWIYNRFDDGRMNPSGSVIYAEIFSLEFEAEGGPPIGYLALDNRPPPGWEPSKLADV